MTGERRHNSTAGPHPPTGARVTRNFSEGTTNATVRRGLTPAIEIDGHHVAATGDDLHYVLVIDTTGE
jgi:hypothetical protein